METCTVVVAEMRSARRKCYTPEQINPLVAAAPQHDFPALVERAWTDMDGNGARGYRARIKPWWPEGEAIPVAFTDGLALVVTSHVHGVTVRRRASPEFCGRLYRDYDTLSGYDALDTRWGDPIIRHAALAMEIAIRGRDWQAQISVALAALRMGSMIMISMSGLSWSPKDSTPGRPGKCGPAASTRRAPASTTR